jgi:hypothetical protein
MLSLVFIWLPVSAIFISGCGDAGPPMDQVFTPPAFSAALEVNADQETLGSLIVTNTGEHTFPRDEAFEAEMNLWDQNTTPMFKIEVPTIQEIQPGETIYIASGYWHLDPGVYFLTWGSPKYGGVITVFSVIEKSDRLYLGELQSFRTKPANYVNITARAGSVQSFSLDDKDTIIIQGETPIPDLGCVFPLIFDQSGLLDGIPIGQCASIAEGRWQMQIPPDPADFQINIQPDTSYRIILFSDDLSIAPSEPFEIIISPPPVNN